MPLVFILLPKCLVFLVLFFLACVIFLLFWHSDVIYLNVQSGTLNIQHYFIGQTMFARVLLSLYMLVFSFLLFYIPVVVYKVLMQKILWGANLKKMWMGLYY
jgi:hypothetical protein